MAIARMVAVSHDHSVFASGRDSGARFLRKRSASFSLPNIPKNRRSFRGGPPFPHPSPLPKRFSRVGATRRAAQRRISVGPRAWMNGHGSYARVRRGRERVGLRGAPALDHRQIAKVVKRAPSFSHGPRRSRGAVKINIWYAVLWGSIPAAWGASMTKMIALALGLVLTAAAFTARAAEQQQPPNAQSTAPPEPRSCQQLHEETNKCDTGMRSCDQRVITRLEGQCQRDEKRLPRVLGPRDGGRP